MSGQDELSTLGNWINGMLEELQKNQRALRDARSDLEQRVAQRTAELAERGELVKLLWTRRRARC